MELTKEQLAQYQQIRDDFQKKKTDITNKIDEHEISISLLKNQLKMPTIEGCDPSMTCKICSINSMEYAGYQPGQGEHFWWYKCVLCGYEDCHT